MRSIELLKNDQRTQKSAGSPRGHPSMSRSLSAENWNHVQRSSALLCSALEILCSALLCPRLLRYYHESGIRWLLLLLLLMGSVMP